MISCRLLDRSKPANLFWYRHKGNYFPCRECEKEEALGLNISQSWDTNVRTLIQFIEYPTGLGARSLVSRNCLTPYHGNDDKNNNEKWCAIKCKNYIKHLKKHTPTRYKSLKSSLNVNLKAEILWLGRVLQNVRKMEEEEKEKKKNAKLSKLHDLVIYSDDDDDDDTNVNESDELDEPYTQDWGEDDEYKDIKHASAMTLEPSKKKEPIRPGDVISYHSHVYVSGDKRGLREATVLSVNAKGNPILRLSNGDCLPKDTQIKRIKIVYKKKLVDHNGIFRPIDYFKLTTALHSNIQIQTESQRLQTIIEKNMKSLSKTLEANHLPTDMLHSFPSQKHKSMKRKRQQQQQQQQQQPQMNQLLSTSKRIKTQTIHKEKSNSMYKDPSPISKSKNITINKHKQSVQLDTSSLSPYDNNDDDKTMTSSRAERYKKRYSSIPIPSDLSGKTKKDDMKQSRKKKERRISLPATIETTKLTREERLKRRKTLISSRDRHTMDDFQTMTITKRK